MPLRRGSVVKCFAMRLAAILGIAAATAGCNSGLSSNQALNEQFKNNSQFTRVAVARFAGKVAVDGQPPAKDCKLFVILNEVQHLDANAHAAAPRLYASCDADGKFVFGTYARDDGAAAGKYVVTFVELHAPNGGTPEKSSGAAFRSNRAVGGSRKYKPPDELKNLYNDPDQNVKEDRFNVNLEPSGKADYEFDLSVAGKEAAPAGANAVSSITGPG